MTLNLQQNKFGQRLSQIVEIQNRVTQMEINHKAVENKLKHEQAKIKHGYEIFNHKIGSLNKDSVNLRTHGEILEDDIK